MSVRTRWGKVVPPTTRFAGSEVFEIPPDGPLGDGFPGCFAPLLDKIGDANGSGFELAADPWDPVLDIWTFGHATETNLPV